MGTYLPRYFGYRPGLTFYTWTSNQYSQFGTKPTRTTVRDSTYVLDEILGNESELPLLNHTVDTAGFTEVDFALFRLGLRLLAPALKDHIPLPDGFLVPALLPTSLIRTFNKKAA
jgi:TnpA family transposase